MGYLGSEPAKNFWRNHIRGLNSLSFRNIMDLNQLIISDVDVTYCSGGKSDAG